MIYSTLSLLRPGTIGLRPRRLKSCSRPQRSKRPLRLLLQPRGGLLESGVYTVHCPKSNQHFRDITRNVEKNETRNIPRSISFSLLHFALHLGKPITYGTVYWRVVMCPASCITESQCQRNNHTYSEGQQYYDDLCTQRCECHLGERGLMLQYIHMI